MSIIVENVSKKFLISQQKGYKTLREEITNSLNFGKNKEKNASLEKSIFWALNDISFEVKRGEVLGLIGRNGAGKSTLLKMIARIIDPTSGKITLKGRVGSLLEVGTGFHPELSGRENIYLNGTILGMSRQEIRRKEDDIIDYAEIRDFIDTPVKRYSSGMYMRLAFAIAAQLEPEIMLIDEVLAVGDANFQKKCLNSMQDIGKSGRTIIFVSHSMNAINRLCTRAILLEKGKIVLDGPTHAVSGLYMSSDVGATASRIWDDEDLPGNDTVRLKSIKILNDNGICTDSIPIEKPMSIEFRYRVLKNGCTVTPNMHVLNQDGVTIFVAGDTSEKTRSQPKNVGEYISRAIIPAHFLNVGTYVIDAAISTMTTSIVHVHERDSVSFQGIESLENTKTRGDYVGEMPGLVRPYLEWQTEELNKQG